MFANIENNTVGVSRHPRPRYEFCSECNAGSLGEVRTSIEKMNEEVSDYSRGYDILLGLRIGAVGFSLLGGMALGVYREVVRAAEGGLIDVLPLLVHGRLAEERHWVKFISVHDPETWLLRGHWEALDDAGRWQKTRWQTSSTPKRFGGAPGESESRSSRFFPMTAIMYSAAHCKTIDVFSER